MLYRGLSVPEAVSSGDVYKRQAGNHPAQQLNGKKTYNRRYHNTDYHRQHRNLGALYQRILKLQHRRSQDRGNPDDEGIVQRRLAVDAAQQAGRKCGSGTGKAGQYGRKTLCLSLIHISMERPGVLDCGG